LFNLIIIFCLDNIFLFFKEYERVVIFRLGRLLSGGARGPGVFFIIPCVDIFEKIDLRVQNFDVPPQEVILLKGVDFQ
jgi:erythrocyte band 7 integral membrane protein